MLLMVEMLLFLALALIVLWQVILPAFRDEPLFPWLRYRRLHRESARARAARYEASLVEKAASEWRAAYREQDATTQESTRWPSTGTKPDSPSPED
jgi:hypothetical protein